MFVFALSGHSYFCTMPFNYGLSFANNIFFVIIGVYVSKHRCLSSLISSITLLNEEAFTLVHATAFIEAALIIGLLTLIDGVQDDMVFLPFLIIGFLCLRDYSMLICQA